MQGPRRQLVENLATEWLLPIAIAAVLIFTSAGVTVIKLAEVAESIPVTMIADADNNWVTP